MPESAPRRGERLVTLATLRLPLPAPTEGAELEGTPRVRLAASRLAELTGRLAQEHERIGAGVMIAVRDREVSRLQSELARRGPAAEPLAAGGMEVKFGTGFHGGDWFGWLFSLLDWVDRMDAHPMLRPTSLVPGPLGDRARIALAADWGTGLYGAPRIATHIRRTGPFDLLMHLGDVYYSGTPEEVQDRFIDLWPIAAGGLNRALNSNHEMYSGGYGYFARALPYLGQPSSYFALENSDWLLVALDTAYVDHDLDSEQVAWLNLVLEENARAHGGTRKKLLLFSHQQLFSPFEAAGEKLARALRQLLESGRVHSWYWGHEHQAIVYDPHPRFGLRARCLGNGGIPEPRRRDVREAPADRAVGAVAWKRLEATAAAPGCLVLDGPNPDIAGEEERFGPHGYVTIELDGPRLTERFHLSDGTEVYTSTTE